MEAAKFSNLLLKIRHEVIAQRKEAERQAQKEAEERAELIMTVFAILLIIVAAISGAGAWPLRSNKGDIDLNFTIDKLLDGASKSLNDGFRSIKMRLGKEFLSEDLKRLDAMKNHLPDNVRLMADANEAWRIDQAVHAFKEIEKFNLVWLEEPIKPDDFNGYAFLRSLGKIPIAAGENLHTLAEVNSLINVNGVDFLEPDLTTCGGITPFMKIAKLAEINNLPICSHGVHELHVHLLASCPNASYLEFHAWRIDDFIENPLKVNNGYTIAPELPGHGINFDLDKLNQFLID